MGGEGGGGGGGGGWEAGGVRWEGLETESAERGNTS